MIKYAKEKDFRLTEIEYIRMYRIVSGYQQKRKLPFLKIRLWRQKRKQNAKKIVKKMLRQTINKMKAG